jgi:hypothetical protein
MYPPLAPLCVLWILTRENVATSVFSVKSYLDVTAGSLSITSGTLLEEPLYLSKVHFTALLASAFIAVPLCIFYGIVDHTYVYQGRLVRLYTNGGRLQKAQPKVAYCTNEAIFVGPPGPQASLQEAETHTAVRHG